MDKLIYNDEQEGLLERAAGALVCLLEGQRPQVKSAASSVISNDLIRANLPDDRHFAMHVIAMGDAENYGPNKNFDLWPASGLEKSSGTYGHHTFVKNGHFFREHNNRSKDKAIGTIKASAWNPEMHRVELIVHGDKDKAAPEYAMAKAGKVVSVSMSARVSHDRCTICDHHAKSSSLYCDHLKKRMGQWHPEHKKFAFAINDYPSFFDISAVRNPADRIAHYLEYQFSDGNKSSSGPAVNFSDLRAKQAGILLPQESELGWSTPAGRQWLAVLAEEASYQQGLKQAAHDERYYWTTQGIPYAFDPDRFLEQHRQAMSELPPGQLFRKLAQARVILPFKPFFSYVTQQNPAQVDLDPRYKAAQVQLPEIFQQLAQSPADPEMEVLCAPAKFACDDACGSDGIDRLLDQVAEDFSTKKPLIQARLLQIRFSPSKETSNGIISILSKASSTAINAGREYARAYACYKIASLLSWPDLSPDGDVDAPIISLLVFPQ